jgi:choline dehydrogenase-like flavoprotein
MSCDTLVIGSGAGGAAVAYHLTQTGQRVLLLEKGLPLPQDGSTLDPQRVLRQGAFLSDEAWTDGRGRTVVPEEHFNLGGKTKWYGAALLRFAPHEFEADPAHQCLGWPIGYDDLAPFYDEAEQLLGVHRFPAEPGMRRLAEALQHQDGSWQRHHLALGLSPEILSYPDEARHFDAFASVRGLKSDAQTSLLARVMHRPNLELMTGKAVAALMPAAHDPTRIAGVLCADGSRYGAQRVVLAAGALHSPRLLQDYLASTGLAATLPSAAMVGRHYKSHLLTAMLAFSHRRVTDRLCKTMLLTHEQMPHSTVQTLGGNLAEEIVASQLPALLPQTLARSIARRAFGLFLQTEDGSHGDNRIVTRATAGGRPQIDYDAQRLGAAAAEHRTLVTTLRRQLLRLGYIAVARSIPLSGTAHACGTLVAGHDPTTSVVDSRGRVHGLANLFVACGSVLPRSSRVNPALTIYAWGLRVAALLDGRDSGMHDDLAQRPPQEVMA